jgi:hypothetical protein
LPEEKAVYTLARVEVRGGVLPFDQMHNRLFDL